MKKLLLTASFAFLSTAAFAADDQAVAIAQLTAKLGQLEEENRRLNGKIEELEHQIVQTNNAATLQAQKVAAAQAAAAQAPAQQQQYNPYANQPMLGQYSQQQQQPVATTASGAEITRPNQYVTKVAQPAAANTEAYEEALEQEFEVAFKSVAAEDYKNARPALKSFIEKHPGTALSGEAYFWLGEIAWSERDFNNAAINYLKGYKEAPTGDKAPENILKMALTLKELNKKEEACKYVARFETEFPDAHSDLQNKAANAKSQLACK